MENFKSVKKMCTRVKMHALNSTLRENYEALSLSLSRSWVPWPTGITMDYQAATAVEFLNFVIDTFFWWLQTSLLSFFLVQKG